MEGEPGGAGADVADAGSCCHVAVGQKSRTIVWNAKVEFIVASLTRVEV